MRPHNHRGGSGRVKAEEGAFSGEESRLGSSRKVAREVGSVCLLGPGAVRATGVLGLCDWGEIFIPLNEQFKDVTVSVPCSQVLSPPPPPGSAHLLFVSVGLLAWDTSYKRITQSDLLRLAYFVQRDVPEVDPRCSKAPYLVPFRGCVMVRCVDGRFVGPFI